MTEATTPRIAAVQAAPSGSAAVRATVWRRWLLARARQHAAFLAIFILAFSILTLNVNTPWASAHEDNGLVFESIAINQIRLGLGVTKGQDFQDARVNPPVIAASGIHPQGVSVAGQFSYFTTGPTQPQLYGHHPPALGLTIAAGLLTFGYHYWVVRAVPLLYTLAALVLLYALVTLLFDQWIATLAALLFISFPVIAYYGRDVAHEAPTLAWSLGLALCYTLWRRDGRRAWLLGMAACVALGAAYGWPMVFFAWILAGVDIVATRRVSWPLIAATCGVATVMFVALAAQIVWADNGSFSTLHDAFFLRAATDGNVKKVVYAERLITFNVEDFGWWGSLALAPALVALGLVARREGLSPRLRAPLYFGLAGVAHIIIFREGAFVHDYWQFYLAPFYALVIAWGAVTLARRLWRDTRVQAAALALAGLVGLALNAPTILALYTYTSGHLGGPHTTQPLITLAQALLQALSH